MGILTAMLQRKWQQEDLAARQKGIMAELGQAPAQMGPAQPGGQMQAQPGSGLWGGSEQQMQAAGRIMALPGMEGIGGQMLQGMLARQAPSMLKPTTMMQNIAAMGLQPGTPEYQDMMRQAVLKPRTQVTTNVGMPNQSEMLNQAMAMESIQAQQQIEQSGLGDYVPDYLDQQLAHTPAGLGNLAVSPEYQQFLGASNAWIQANLRPESGAVLSQEEIENYRRTYFPVAGDTKEEVNAKAQRRLQKLQSRQQMAGRAGGRGQVVSPPPPPMTVRQTPPPIPPGFRRME